MTGLSEFAQRIHRVITLRGDYRHVFDRDDPRVRAVLADLARFAGMQSSSVAMTQAGAIDPLAMAVMEGRREVFRRILEHTPLDDRDLAEALAKEDNPYA